MYGSGGILGGPAPERTGAPGVWKIGEVANAMIDDRWPTAQDPDFASVVYLAHFGRQTPGKEQYPNYGNGLPGLANNSSVANTALPLSGAVVKFGRASYLQPNVAGALLRTGTVGYTSYNFGTGDWTVEFWVYPTAASSNTTMLDMRPNGTNSITVRIYIAATRSVRLYVNAADRISGANDTIAANAWHHIAAARSAGTTRLFVNGSQVGSDYSDSNTYVAAGCCLGNAAGGGGGQCVGYYDELRITKGVGRYTVGFTPPSAPFPDY